MSLTSHVTGDETYSLRISDSQGGADYSSKEGSNAPKLLVALGGATPQSCSGTATATPTPGATNTPTATNTPGPSPTPTNTSAPTATQPPQGAFNNATFVYDGDGKRVKSTFNGTTTTYFVGSHYEVTGSTITKYYYAGAQRVAMRTNGTLNYLLGDHLGSTSLITDSAGVKTNEQRYKAWGETRYTFGNEKTKYQYTGQFSYVSDFGLMYYGARWYDTSLGKFNQPDTIIPPTQGVQAWDRYAYSNNNPVKYTDPSGHFIETAWDFAMIGVDLIDIAQNGLNWSNGAALAVDVASAIIPGIPAVGGVLLKTAKAANALDNAVDTANAIDNAVDAGNAVENAVNAVTGTNVTPTNLYAFGNTTGPRPPRPRKDVFPDDFGNIGPESPPFPNGASTFADPSQAPLTGPYHELPAGTTLPDGMSVIPDGVDINRLSPHPETHHTLYPSTQMPYNEFVGLFQNLPWRYVGKK